MSKQEIIASEYERLKKARNERTLKAKFNRMTNEQLLSYVKEKWDASFGGEA